MSGKKIPVRVKLLVIIIVSSTMVASCADRSPLAPSAALITDVLWKLRSFQRPDSSSTEIQDPEQFTLRFGHDGRITVRADCNTCFGRYELTGQVLHVDALACTRAYCGSASLDAEYVKALESGGSVGVTEGVLTIAGVRAVLLFRQ